jgi:hypothetical protein
MFNSNSHININAIPSNWIFENYFNLSEKLTGQSVKINSVLNSDDHTPSLVFYFKNGKYYFKCFSTGASGGPIDLLCLHWDKSFTEVKEIVIRDYNEFLKTGKTFSSIEGIQKIYWKVTDYKIRPWNKGDAKFWLKYNIGTTLLNMYNVKPLEYYIFSKHSSYKETGDIIKVSKNYMYGYFTEDGELYKIYNPYDKSRKFIKIKKHIQGLEQCKRNDNLLITKSLKDVMSIKSLSLRIDIIAAESENVLLSPSLIDSFKERYQRIGVYLDSDKEGIEAMKKYNNIYNIPYLYLPYAKDFSDLVHYQGINKAKELFIPKLDQCLTKYEFIFY